jgi:hypothetical protein
MMCKFEAPSSRRIGTHVTMSLNKKYLHKDTLQRWIATFHEDAGIRYRSETHFWALLEYDGEIYGIDRVGQHKVLKQVKKEFVKYVILIYKRWYIQQRFTALELISFLEDFAFFPDVTLEIQNFVIELQEETEAIQRARKRLRTRNLGDVAQDGQNVHTTEVVVQTNETMEVLQSVTVKQKQKTLSEIEAAWVGQTYVDYTKLTDVLDDMKKWGNTETVCAENDWAYRKALRGLWAKIQTNPELVKRLWEECLDSLSMCAQGHLSRLANVLVGFEEGVKAPINMKELFQNEISLLATKEIPQDEKEVQAKTLMDTYSIPDGERQAWLDALL